MFRRFLVALLVGALALGLAAPAAEASPGRRFLKTCALGLALTGAAVLARTEVRDLPRAQEDKISGPEVSVAAEAAGAVIGPLMIPIDATVRTQGRGFSLENFADETSRSFRLDYGFVLSNWALFFFLYQFRERLKQIRVERFVKAADALEPSPPERVLVLVSARNNDMLGAFARFYARNRFGESARVERFRSPVSMRRKLREIAREVARNPESAYDRVEVFFHGHPRGFETEDGHFVTAKKLSNELYGPYRIAKPGAQLRVFSCSLGRSLWRTLPNGQRHVGQILAHALLPDGGSAVLATRNIFIEYGYGLAEGFKPEDRPRPTLLDRWTPFAYIASGWGPFLLLMETVVEYRRKGLRGVFRDVQTIEIEKTPAPDETDED